MALLTPHSWTSEAKCSKHRWGLEKGEYGEGWVCPSHTQGEWCPEGRSEAATGKRLGSESHDERAGPASTGRTHGHMEGASIASPVRHDSCHSCCTRVTQAWGPAPTCRPLWPWETHPQLGTGNGTGAHVNSLTGTHHQMHPSVGARLSVGELRKLGFSF